MTTMTTMTKQKRLALIIDIDNKLREQQVFGKLSTNSIGTNHSNLSYNDASNFGVKIPSHLDNIDDIDA